ncbi:hypothetical protein [Microcoleus sp.]|uniref:hypothetical protein n=1 Tax=Microcoleus sp. TaxID=44472 RepID=UPI003593AD5E
MSIYSLSQKDEVISGIGHWELGIGRSEAEGLGIGHWEWGIGRSEAEGLGIGHWAYLTFLITSIS